MVVEYNQAKNTKVKTSVVKTVCSLHAAILAFRKTQARIALVPTMGALHSGHIALIDFAQDVSERVIVSIFVNPTQFSASEDLESYPRRMKEDLDILNSKNVDLVFMPSEKEMYGEDFSTSVIVSGPSEGLEGYSRPDFFNADLATISISFPVVLFLSL